MEEETNLDSGNIHFCTQYPCSIEEAWYAKIFELGSNTNYINISMDKDLG